MDSTIELARDVRSDDVLIQPVILTGGAGTRLWPLSRKSMPKPLLPLLSERTLLQDTVSRTGGDSGFGSPVLVCNREHLPLIQDQLAAIGVTPRAIIAEPVGRNTAPALTATALVLIATDPDAVMLVQPSDHVIADAAAFRRTVAAGMPAARQGWLVTFGLKPTRPETGYGYISPAGPVDGAEGVYAIGQFIEKPPVDEAARLIAGGDVLWNSGMFLLSARRYLQEMESLHPAILHGCAEAVARGQRDGHTLVLDAGAFGGVKDISIDRAVMERTAMAAVVPLATHWNDVGSWRSLRDEACVDGNGNVVIGDAMLQDVTNSYIRAEEGMVAAVGLDGVVVVSTGDAVLVASAEESAKVGTIVQRMNGDSRCEAVRHRAVHRPWGMYKTIESGPRHQVKQIVVNPGGRLSLQRHHHRSEHWIVIAGTARVVCGEDERTLFENDSIYIPAGTQHRLENPGRIPLRVIEVQYGSYLGEDDIVRVEDVYGRA